LSEQFSAQTEMRRVDKTPELEVEESVEKDVHGAVDDEE
jgi:hypothetical protein